jgi:spore germination cell wall hydrolase CwlJ-like protein
MKAAASVMIMGALATVLWGGVVSRDLLAQAESGKPEARLPAPAPAPAPPVRDADRRAELNNRLQHMLAEGRGSRLTDAKPIVRQAAARRAAGRPERGADTRLARAAASSDAASIRSAVYSPPRLDLTTPAAMPRDPLTCLTQAVYYEARSENEDGQAAVAEVVMNRAASGRYPADICEVVYQRNARTCQFTFTCDGSIGRSRVNPASWARAERIARSVYSGEAKAILPGRSVNYHANYVKPSWSRRLERVHRIGAHIFYGAPLDGSGTPGADNIVRPTRDRGLVFLKNEAIEQAYARLTGRSEQASPGR